MQEGECRVEGLLRGVERQFASAATLAVSSRLGDRACPRTKSATGDGTYLLPVALRRPPVRPSRSIRQSEWLESGGHVEAISMGSRASEISQRGGEVPMSTRGLTSARGVCASDSEHRARSPFSSTLRVLKACCRTMRCTEIVTDETVAHEV